MYASVQKCHNKFVRIIFIQFVPNKLNNVIKKKVEKGNPFQVSSATDLGGQMGRVCIVLKCIATVIANVRRFYDLFYDVCFFNRVTNLYIGKMTITIYKRLKRNIYPIQYKNQKQGCYKFEKQFHKY